MEPSSSKTADQIAAQNTVMFGTTVSTIFNSIHDNLDQSIRSHISSLPIICSSQEDDDTTNGENDVPREEQIYNKITQVYVNHMDVAKLYTEKELFCMNKKWTKKRRGRILDKYLELMETPLPSTDSEKIDGTESKEGMSNDEAATKTRYTIPVSKEDIPTETQVKDIHTELNELRLKLREKSSEKMKLLYQLQALDAAQQSSEKVDASLSSKIKQGGSEIEKAVKELNETKKQVKQLSSDGNHLLDQMDILSSQKQPSTETEEFSEAMKAKALHIKDNMEQSKKRSLEEDYRERKEKIVVQKGVLNLLKKK
ncbi:hypothetical protein CTEN210_12512 [Chaetoceros tenuissimus]|uniref:Uncharacterized protein n=1 Tax=Chaetoceros tenuissimus TaxID=426638 RepID=A0AAD3D1B9_9STRA|nr:hypothetical protein CTEN210_12512 [Chaetoceros tenuissimus]